MRDVEIIVVPHRGTSTYDIISADADGGIVIERFVGQELLDLDDRSRVTLDSFGDFIKLFNTYRKLVFGPRLTEEAYEAIVREKED